MTSPEAHEDAGFITGTPLDIRVISGCLVITAGPGSRCWRFCRV
ncbi:SymE family type I addiction module toxin [Salmonella enterica]|nr:type I addiction module toxin, SymE family [Salmonella enterica]